MDAADPRQPSVGVPGTLLKDLLPCPGPPKCACLEDLFLQLDAPLGLHGHGYAKLVEERAALACERMEAYKVELKHEREVVEEPDSTPAEIRLVFDRTSERLIELLRYPLDADLTLAAQTQEMIEAARERMGGP